MTDDLGRGSYKVDADATGAEQALDKVEADAKAKLDGAEKQATDAATRTSTKLAALSGAAVKTVALGASATFAAMSALALQGQQAMAKFQAETGATQDEAKAALADMDRLAGQNLQSFDQVAESLTQVRTQMGLTGQAAADMTDHILKFSTATGTDAVANVKAFDDVSDAWNLTAQDTIKLMDVLVASHQQYGGSIEESQALLQQLAPTLQAANMSWEDATAILNLFNHAGVDAAAAGTAFNRALQKVHSPEELQQLVKDVAATQDPFERAQKAADLFGARAGPKLASALADSGGDLSKFAVSASDAAGAVDKAASAIQDTLPNKIKMAVSGALASLRDMGTQFGPLLTGAASLASLGTGFAKALKLDTAISNAVSSAVGTPLVQNAWKSAGGKLGGLIGIGVVVGLAALAPDLQGAADALGKDLNQRIFGNHDNDGGMLAGTIFDSFGDAVHTFMNAAYDAPWPIGNKDAPDWASLGGDAGKEYADGFAGGLGAGGSFASSGPSSPAEARAIIMRLFGLEDPAAADSAASDLTDRLTHMWSAVGLAVHANIMEHPQPTPVAQLPQQVAAEAPKASAGISDVLTHMWSSVPTAPARVLGLGYATEFANGLKAGKAEVASGMAELRDALEHPLRGIHTVAKVMGALTGKDLADGLKSSDPYTRSVAEATRDDLLAKLRKLQSMGYDIGKKGMALLGEGIQDGTGDAADKAGTAAGKVKSKLNINAKDSGHTIGADWAAAIAAAITASVRGGALNDALVRVNNRMQVASPSPKEGPLHGVEKGGYATGRSYAQAMGDGLASVGLGATLGNLLPGNLGVASSLLVQHTGTVQVQLTGDTIAAARAQGASWADVAALGRGAVVSVADVAREMGRMRNLPVGGVA